MFEWKNPDFELRKRALICRNNKTYKVIILRIHQGTKIDNPRVYDASHHSIETRHSKNQHSTCSLFTRKVYAEKELEETDEIFWKLALRLNFADEKSASIFFPYILETLNI